MRRHLRILTVLFVLALLVTPVVAQHGHGPRHARPDTPDSAMHGRMIARLDLSAEQRERVDQLMTGHHDLMLDLVEREKAARAEMNDQILAAEFSEGAIRAAVFMAAEAQADVVVERAQLRQQIRQELTETQQERMDEMLERQRTFLKNGRGIHDGRRFRSLEPRREHKKLDQD